jgi:hypothetical protein
MPFPTPVFLKNEGRMRRCSPSTSWLLVQALIERELRHAMKSRNIIDDLPLYPERRSCERPTTEQILRDIDLIR